MTNVSSIVIPLLLMVKDLYSISGRPPVVLTTRSKWGDLGAVPLPRKSSNHGIYRLDGESCIRFRELNQSLLKYKTTLNVL